MTGCITPHEYRISVDPDLNRFTFTGRVTLVGHAHEPVDSVTLDCAELAIWQCHANVQGGDRPDVDCRFTLDPANAELTVHFPGPIAGRVELTIDYCGKINDRMAGFYRSRIHVADGPAYIAVTQFQESDARRAFPCFDHPAQKAVFTIEMVIDQGLTAVSNTAIQTIADLDDGRQAVTFQPTPKMSTYLVFFGVGPFEIHTDTVDRRVRAVCLPDTGDQTVFGREFGRKALAYGEDFYAIDYPLPKLDLIAVPDFAFGAMENWGAITFRENLLLHVPGVTSREALARICEVIAHEIAHQWFGNLVTPEDWKYLWLNESFATYFGYGMVDQHYPEWEIWHQFIRSQTETALTRDALKETFAIEMPGGAQVAITTSTAPIIYSKGGSILRQLEGWIGPEAFKAGLRRYLTDFAYGCAASHNLWDALSVSSGMPVAELMRSWVTQPGFPMITVGRSGNRLSLHQQRFTYLPGDAEQIWMVPVTITCHADDGRSQTLTALLERETAQIALPPGTRAYTINTDHTGFFHTRYADTDNLTDLGEMIEERKLTAVDRWGLQNDLFALAKAGHVSMSAFLDMAERFHGESAFLPLASIDSHLFEACLVLRGATRDRTAQTAMRLMDQALDTLGLQPSADEPQTAAMLRDQLLVHGAMMGNATIRDFLSDRFQDFLNGIPIDPDIFRGVITAGAVGGGQSALDAILQRFATSRVEHERMTLAGALGAFSRWPLLEQALDFSLKKVPDRIRFMPLVAAAGNPAALDRLWPWFEANQSRIETMHPLLYERVVAAIVPIAGLQDLERTRSFCERLHQKHPRLKDVIALSLERLTVNEHFRRREIGQPSEN